METISNDRLLAKLLSHRFRGFSPIENSASAAAGGFVSPVNRFEIDTRVSKDGTIYVYHDPQILLHNARTFICEESSHALARFRYPNGESLMTLDQLLGMFKEFVTDEKTLYIDIKDYGFEAAHLEAVRSFDLEKQVVFVSWIPQTLLQLHRLGTTVPLILSHINLFKYGVGGRFLVHCLKNRMFHFARQVVVGMHRVESDPGPWAVGYRHNTVCNTLPRGLVSVLAGSGGGICIACRFFSPLLMEYCNEMGLTLAVYSVGDTAGFLKYAGIPGVHRVFCDNAPLVLEEIV